MTAETCRQQYTSDLTDERWELVGPFIEPSLHMGRPREVDLHEVTNAIHYLLRTGCQWRDIPHDFPIWGTGRSYPDD